MTDPEGGTSRTDAKERESEKCEPALHAHYGWKFARQLERALSERERRVTELVNERDAARLIATGMSTLHDAAEAVLINIKEHYEARAELHTQEWPFDLWVYDTVNAFLAARDETRG